MDATTRVTYYIVEALHGVRWALVYGGHETGHHETLEAARVEADLWRIDTGRQVRVVRVTRKVLA